ncbi:MAG: NAD(P)-dependent oxidoreductase [Acidipropionibacterium acidipropionici]|nr:NAD(P)-dependent oxidoreductase [Acidipropionibacterium acidipropionici]
MTAVSIIGLGAMGRPIARNLLAAGFEVTVWNRSPQPVADLASAGARAAGSVAEALQTGTVISMLSNDQAVTDVLLDSGVLAEAPEGTLHINMATVSTGLARRAADIHADHGVSYLAAPVFGRVPVAEAGNLNILAAGDAALIDRAQPLFDVIGTQTWRLGERPEQANIVKILGNYLIATVIESLGEAVTLAEHSGVDTSQLIDLLTSSLFPGATYTAYRTLIAERRYQPAGFTTTLGRKDLHLALDAADEHGLTLPFGEILRAIFDQAIADGSGDEDWAAITEQLPRGPRR